MRTRILILGLVAALAAAGAATAGDADTWTVKLNDGKTYEGALVRLEPGRYLLQSGDTLLELSDDDIAPATFAKRPRGDAVPDHPVYEVRQYHEIHADRTVTRWWTRLWTNRGKKAVAEWQFGYAPWEQLVADQRSYRDWLGNELHPVYDPPQEKWQYPPKGRVEITLPLPVPIAPGEEGWVTGKVTSAGIEQTDAGLVYRFNGDFSEDNLVLLKVRLPRGATIVSVEPPASSRFEDGGLQYLTWRRYYKKGEVYPLKVVYTLD